MTFDQGGRLDQVDQEVTQADSITTRYEAVYVAADLGLSEPLVQLAQPGQRLSVVRELSLLLLQLADARTHLRTHRLEGCAVFVCGLIDLDHEPAVSAGERVPCQLQVTLQRRGRGTLVAGQELFLL
jgi:hypothetical protein